MPLPRFSELHDRADRQREPASIAAAGGDDPTVLQSPRQAVARGWVRPIVFESENEVRNRAAVPKIELAGMDLRHKAIMYSADCYFGSVLQGARAPAVPMACADAVSTRLNSLALTLGLLDGRG